MKSQTVGRNTLGAEITNVSLHGLWLYVEGKEYFLSFDEYSWFKEAKIGDVLNVKLLHGRHLYWPSLDVDLEVSSLEHPERYPLRYQYAPEELRAIDRLVEKERPVFTERFRFLVKRFV